MGATVTRTGITHDVTRADFLYYAYSACGVRVDWRETFEGLGLQPAYAGYGGYFGFATRTAREVDCMACIACAAGEAACPTT